MKKEMLTIALFLGLSFKSFATSGSANDGPKLFLAIVGFLLILLGLLSGVDYLQKNGKTMMNNAVTFFKNTVTFLKSCLNNVKSDYFNLTYS